MATNTIGYIRQIGVGNAEGAVFAIISEKRQGEKRNVTRERCRMLLDQYEAVIGIAKPCLWSDHLRGMVPKMRTMLDEGREEKFMRWLGFMQGVFWVIGWFGIDDLKRHNMSDGEKFDDAA